jgi:hypothetical protein
MRSHDCILAGLLLAAVHCTGCGREKTSDRAPAEPAREATSASPVPFDRVMNYLPDRPRDLESAGVGQFQSSAFYREVTQRNPAPTNRIVARELECFPGGIAPADVDRVTSEGIPPSAGGGGLVVFTTRRKVSAEEMLKRLPQPPGEQATIGPYTAYRCKPRSFCVAEDRVIVVGEWPQLCAILRRQGRPTLDEDIRTALGLTDFERTWVSLNGNAFAAAGGHFPNRGIWGSFNPAAVLPQDEKDVLIHMVNWGDRLTAEAILLSRHKNELVTKQQEAEAVVRGAVEGAATPEMKAVMSGVRVTRRDDLLIATGAVARDQASALTKQGLFWGE